MKRIKIILTTVLLLSILTSSCVSKKDIVYFQNGEINQSSINRNYQTAFKPGDMLEITVSAADKEAVLEFNLTTSEGIKESYILDNEGYIYFPRLGKLKLGGLTREKAIKLIADKLNPDYVKSPTISIKISNFTITVLGDVKKPGVYNVPNERITLLQAIGLAGDLNISGKRKNIIVERDFKKYIVDITSNDVFTSPVYFLQQNDLIYVEPNKATSQNAAYNRNSGLFISIGSIILSLITILSR